VFGVEESQIICTNLALIRQDVDHAYQQYLDWSHHGHPSVIEPVHTGQPGRPAYYIDPSFLQWAYTSHSISSISQFLGISRGSVRNALLAHGIAEPQTSPFISDDRNRDQKDLEAETPLADHDFVLDPLLSGTDMPQSQSIFHHESTSQPTSSSAHHSNDGLRITSFTGPLSAINDAELMQNLIR